MWREIEIGSNRFLDTPGIIIVQDERQVFVEVGSDGQLLLTMDLYDRSGAHIAKLRRNAWAFHQERYEVRTHPQSLQLLDVSTPAHWPVLHAAVIGPSRLRVSQGFFYSANGVPISITPEHLKIGGGVTLQNMVIENCADGIAIG